MVVFGEQMGLSGTDIVARSGGHSLNLEMNVLVEEEGKMPKNYPVVSDEYKASVGRARIALRNLIARKYCAPLMLHIARHSARTYDQKSKTFGMLNDAEEGGHRANSGLDIGVRLLQPIKDRIPFISYADFYQLAGVVALEVSTGLEVPFQPGREDKDVCIFSWRDKKDIVGNTDILPRARMQKGRDTCYADATSAYMLTLFRLIQARKKVKSEFWLEDISADHIIELKEVVGTGKLQYIFDHIVKKGFVPLTDKEYANGKQRTSFEGDPRRAFGECHSIYQMSEAQKWTSSKICKEIFLNGAVIGVFPICDDYFSEDVRSGRRIYEAKEQMPRLGPKKKLETHAVPLVGWGQEGGTYYFDYLNSEGVQWGRNGFGRVAMKVVVEYHILQIERDKKRKASD